jgi:hypothetical protein
MFYIFKLKGFLSLILNCGSVGLKIRWNPWRYSSDEPWPAEQPPLAVFADCT